MSETLTILGHSIRQPSAALECFAAPEHVREVTLTSDEFTSLCPVTAQPDFQTVTIRYQPNTRCLESKSLKLYLWTYRESGAFCESLSERIAQDVLTATGALWVRVTVAQKPRGGIAITATAEVHGV